MAKQLMEVGYMKHLVNAWLSMKAPETARSYRGIIGEWGAFLQNLHKSDLEECWIRANREDALAYLSFLRAKRGQVARHDASFISSANSTIRKKIEVLRCFYALLESEQLANDNPWDTRLITKPNPMRNMKRQTRMIPFTKIREFIDLPDPSSRAGLRDRTLLRLILGGALRLNEALHLSISDIRISFQQGQSWALALRNTKSGPDQLQPIPSWCQEHLTQLVAQRRSDSDKPSDNDALFVKYNLAGQVTGALIYVTAARIIKRYTLAAGLEHISAHSLRKTALSKLGSEGVSLIQIRNFARHQSVRSTERYVQINETPEG